jgi:hypothetical protein
MNQRSVPGWQLTLIAIAGLVIFAVGVASGGILGIVCGGIVLTTVPITWYRQRNLG